MSIIVSPGDFQSPQKSIISAAISPPDICHLCSPSTLIVDDDDDMKLKSMCFSAMDDDDDRPCFGSDCKKKKKKRTSCKHPCTNVINEYRETRMTLLRERCDKNGIDYRKGDTTPRKCSDGDNQETMVNVLKLREKFEKSNIQDHATTSENLSSDTSSLSSVHSAKYEENFERSVEQDLDTLENAAEDGVYYRRNFSELNIDTSHLDERNRMTQLSTKSNSDSQLETARKSCELNKLLTMQKEVCASNGGKLSKASEILKELVETERHYVESLRCIVEDYLPEMLRSDIAPGLRGQKFSVFCNIEKIYDFHKNIFLRDLEQCMCDWTQIGACYRKHKNVFDIYSLYNKNKPKSDELITDYGWFFEEKRLELGDSLNLSSLLLKPVQRLARYSLLLDKFLKESDLGADYYQEILQAKDLIVYILRHGDDLLVMDGIKNCDVNLNEQGRLLRQEEFQLIEENGKKALKRRIFLFDELILFSIPNKTNNSEYTCCNSIKMADVGLTDYGDKTKFIIWFRKYQFQKYTLQASSPEVKAAWVNEITNVLMKQAEQYKLAKLAELAALGIQSETRIPISNENNPNSSSSKENSTTDDDDSESSNKKFYSMRSLRGVPGEIKPKKVIDRTTWYCTIRTDETDSS